MKQEGSIASTESKEQLEEKKFLYEFFSSGSLHVDDHINSLTNYFWYGYTHNYDMLSMRRLFCLNYQLVLLQRTSDRFSFSPPV